MCFAPRRRALFRHRNLQKWSDAEVFCTFSLQNVLRATRACTFSTSELPKVVRPWCVLYILTWKCASRHNAVHFFDIAASKSGPTMVCFNILTSKCASRHNGVHFFDIATCKSGPTLRCFVHFHFKMCLAPKRRATFHFSSRQMSPRPAPRSHKSLEKHSVSRLSYLFAHLHLRSSYSFSSTFLSSNLSLLSASLCFSSAHIVGSLTSRLPSMIDIFSSIFRRMISFIIYDYMFFCIHMLSMCNLYFIHTPHMLYHGVHVFAVANGVLHYSGWRLEFRSSIAQLSSSKAGRLQGSRQKMTKDRVICF